MPTHPNSTQNNHLNIPSDALRKSHDKVDDSPVTPAVTGIIYPSTTLDSNTEAETSVYRTPVNHFYNHPNVAASNIQDDPAHRQLEDNSLDKLWSTIRQQKERKMAKEKPKVQSLEEHANILSLSDRLPTVDIDVLEPPRVSEPHVPDPQTLKRRKSMYVSSLRVVL